MKSLKKKKVRLRNSRKVVARDCSWRIKRKKISWFKKQKIHLSVIRWIRSEESESHSVVSDSLQPHELYSPWDSPGQNSEMGSLSLLQGIFPTHGWNPGLPHCSWILYQLSHQGSPRILEWVAYPFSGRSPWPRNQTGVSCLSCGFFTSWAAREAKVWGPSVKCGDYSSESFILEFFFCFVVFCFDFFSNEIMLYILFTNLF